MSNSRLVVFSLAQHLVIASLDVGAKPDVVAYDPVLRRIYTAGLRGVMTVIQVEGPNDYRVLDNIETHLLAHSLAVDSGSHRVFLAYASLFVRPRVAVFTPKP